jgi:hypothetical protein
MPRAKSRPRPAAAPRKPMATARRVSLFEREIRIKLSGPAVEILFDAAAILSEGQLDDDGYFGSTMITIDLARCAALVSDACDAATARRVTDLFAGDARVRARATAIALAEAESRAGRDLRAPQIDLRVRSSGVHVHIDVDVEAAEAGSPDARARV